MNLCFRCLLYGSLTGRRRAEHRQRTSGDAVVRYPSGPRRASPDRLDRLHPPEEDLREPYVGTAEAPDQVTFQRNRFRLPPQRADAERGMLGDEEPASERHTEQLLLSGEPH